MTDAAGAEVAALSLIGNWVALARIVECSHTSGAAAAAVAVDSGRSAQRTIPGNFHSCCSCRIVVVVGAGIAVAVVVVDIGRVDG